MRMILNYIGRMKSLSALLLTCHRWTGLTLGLVVLYMALTGAGLAFRTQLEPLTDAALLAAPVCRMRPLDDLTSAAIAAHPGKLESLRFDPRGGQTLAVHLADGITVYVDPCDGAVRGQRGNFGGLFGGLEQWHRLLFWEAHDVALTIVAGGFLALLVIAGFIVWWPRRRMGMKINAKLKGQALLANIHRTVGFYGGLILLVTAATGLMMVTDVGKAPPRKMAVGDGEPAGPAVLWTNAAAKLSAPIDVLIRLPRRKSDPVRMLVREADAPHPRARDELILDPVSGEVLSYVPYEKTSTGGKFANWLVSVHTGQVGGVFGAALMFCGAASVPVLAYCGILLYWRRRKTVKA